MRRLPLAILALTLGASALAQNHDPLFTATKQQLDVVKIILEQQSAWNKGDLEAYLAHFKDAADTEIILANPVRGIADIRNAFHVNYPSRDAMGTLEDSEIEVRELGENFALATGKYHLARSHKAGGDAEGTFSEVFEKTASGWKVIFSESI